MEKRTLIALALSFMVLGFYPVILQKFYPDYYKKTSQTSSAKPTSTKATAGSFTEKLVKAGAFSPEKDMSFRSDSLQLVFNKEDGGIREIGFPRYMDSETSRPIKFISLKDLGVSTTALLLTSGNDSSLVADHSGQVFGNGASLSGSALGGKVRVAKNFEFSENYSANIKIRFENTTDLPLEMNYELLVGSGVMPRHSIDEQYVEANFFSVADGKKNLKHLKENRSGKQLLSAGVVRWVSVKDRHFSVVVKPKTEDSMTGLVRGLGGHDFSASLVSSKHILPPGGSFEEEFLLYIGPNELDHLISLGLDDLVNFGKFDLIGKLFVGALELLQKICRSYGLAIIALTILINLVLFPLTRVSYMSMKRMQLIQPQMSKLREHHKKSPDKLNKEMMELYKKHKVNPFGGCIPMIAQIPIFIALYVALSKSVILINSRFLWIKDLSSPDRVYLPFSLPFAGNYIHLLPLLMVAAMAVQQKFTQIKMENQDPTMQMQQKMMAVMMPIIFGFVFYQMPSGLVLYWLTNTLIMSAYQLRLKNITLA